MKTAFLIKVRLNSTRLPQKAMLEVNGIPLVQHMIKRLKHANYPNLVIIVCTSKNKENDSLEKIAKEEGVEIFRGNDTDVLQRFYDAAIHFGCDYILKAGADNPLIATEWIPKALEVYKEKKPGLMTLTDLPIGCFFYGVDIKSLKQVIDKKNETDTEVWGGIFEEFGISRINIPVPEALHRPGYRLTVDYPEDFELIKKIIEHFGDDIYKTPTSEILQFLDDHPELAHLNIQNNEKYAQNITKKESLH